MANGDAGDQYARYSDSRKIIGFAEDVIADGMARGRRIKIGRLKHLFGIDRMLKQGFDQSSPLWLTDDTIIKYINHPKARKGATVPLNLLPAVARALNNPKHIYLDVSVKNRKLGYLIYVGTLNHKGMKGKVIKAVVHTDYSDKGEVFHKVKSFGIVNMHNMNHPDFMRIK